MDMLEYQKYARIFGLPEEDIAHADYDIFTDILTVTYGIDQPKYKQKKVIRRASKEFADFFKAPIFVGKSVDYILTAYLKEKEREHMVSELMMRETLPAKVYYTSTDPVFGKMTFKQFIETEVEDRGNYTLADVQNWTRKYNLSENDPVIWVSPKKWVANRYNLPASEWDKAKNIPESEMNVYGIKGNEGFIIPESDDGDEGFLFVFKKSPKWETEKPTELEPWQMVQREAITEAAKPLGSRKKSWGEMRVALVMGRQAAKGTHKEMVEQALSEGKPVPPEVLAEYPELLRKDELEVTRGTGMAEQPRQEKKLYRYYYRSRPPSIGTQPEGFINREAWVPRKLTPKGTDAWGWVEYDRPLTPEELSGYELFEDELVLPKLVKELVQFAYTEGIDEAMKAVLPGDEYYNAVEAWLKANNRWLPHRHPMANIRDEIMRLARITERAKTEQKVDVEALFNKYTAGYSKLSLKAVTYLSDTKLAIELKMAIPELTAEEAKEFAPIIRSMAQKKYEELEAQEVRAPKPSIPAVDFWDEVKDLKIADIEVTLTPGEGRYYKYVTESTFAILENGKKVQITSIIYKGTDATEAMKLGPGFFKNRKQFYIGETIGQNIREDSFLNLNRSYEEYKKQEPRPVQKRLETPRPRAIAGGATARQILTITEPEEYYFGTEVEVMAGADPELEPLFRGTVKRLLNRGELVEVHPEGQPREVSLRVPVDRVIVTRLATPQPPIIKPVVKPEERILGELRAKYRFSRPEGDMVAKAIDSYIKIRDKPIAYSILTPVRDGKYIAEDMIAMVEGTYWLKKEAPVPVPLAQPVAPALPAPPPTKVQTIQEIKQQAVQSIQQAKTIDELKQVLKGIGFLPLPDAEKRQVLDLYQNRFSTLTSEAEKKRRIEQLGLQEFGVKEAVNVLSPSLRHYIQGAQAIRDVIYRGRGGRQQPLRGVLYRARDRTYFVEAQDGQIYSSMGWEDVSTSIPTGAMQARVRA